MIVRGLYRRRWPRIRTLLVLVTQLEAIGFVYELCHYSRCAVLSRKNTFTSNELLKIPLYCEMGMNAHNLNQSGAKVEDKGFSPPGDRVYFYKLPTQHEVARRGRKTKHLAHYHGPATVRGKVDRRDRPYHIEYDGKVFKRDISMLIPEKRI